MRYKQTVIGAAWVVIQPFITMVLFTIFFGRFLGVPTGGLPDPVFYYSSLLPWGYFSGAVSTATTTLVDNQGVITKIYFPRLILPVAAVLPGLLDFLIAFAVLVIIMLAYGIYPGLTFFLIPLFILLAGATAFGVGLWLSVLNAKFRDVRYAIPFAIQLWFFVSPVIYPASAVPAQFRLIYGLNPLTGAIEGFRWALTGRGNPPGGLIFVSVAMVLALIGGGLLYFRRREILIADVI